MTIDTESAEFKEKYAPRLRTEPPEVIGRIIADNWLNRVKKAAEYVNQSNANYNAVTSERACWAIRAPGKNEMLACVAYGEAGFGVAMRGGSNFTQADAERLRDWLNDVFPKGGDAVK